MLGWQSGARPPGSDLSLLVLVAHGARSWLRPHFARSTTANSYDNDNDSYGYNDNNSSDTDWYYNYDNTSYHDYGVLKSTGLYEFTSNFYGYDNDGYYGACSSYLDSDGDGVYED